MPGPNQITSKLRQDVNVAQEDLLKVGAGTPGCQRCLSVPKSMRGSWPQSRGTACMAAPTSLLVVHALCCQARCCCLDGCSVLPPAGAHGPAHAGRAAQQHQRLHPVSRSAAAHFTPRPRTAHATRGPASKGNQTGGGSAACVLARPGSRSCGLPSKQLLRGFALEQVPGGLAGWQRLRAGAQPDGGRCHRGDQVRVWQRAACMVVWGLCVCVARRGGRLGWWRGLARLGLSGSCAVRVLRRAFPVCEPCLALFD